jgi:predicted glycosyltransferase
MEVARKLSDTFDVTVLLGDAAPRRVEVPDGVETVMLPALGMDLDTNVIDIGRSRDLRERIVARRDAMIRIFERLKPRVVAIENFPFTQHGLRGEVLPLVERARNGVYGESLVVCMTDGILIAGSEKGPTRRRNCSIATSTWSSCSRTLCSHASRSSSSRAIRCTRRFTTPAS